VLQPSFCQIVTLTSTSTLTKEAEAEAEAPPAEVKVDCNFVIQPLQVVVVLPVVEHLGLANLQ